MKKKQRMKLRAAPNIWLNQESEVALKKEKKGKKGRKRTEKAGKTVTLCHKIVGR